MNEESVSDAALRQFLLGKVDDKERQRIESLFITNTDLRDRVLAIEQDLIEDYLEDSLTAPDKESFVGQYDNTPVQKRKLRIAKSIKDWAVVQGNVAQATPSAISSWSRLRARLRLKPLFLIPIAATAAVAIVVAVVWLNSRMEQRNRHLAIEQEIVRLNASSSVVADVSLALKPLALRSTTDPRSELARRPDVQVVELSLSWIQKERYPAYRAVVRRVGNDESFTIPNLQAEGDGSVIRVKLPAYILIRGIHQIELSGIAANGTASPSEEYSFTVD